jgi:hypothetical protein
LTLQIFPDYYYKRRRLRFKGKNLSGSYDVEPRKIYLKKLAFIGCLILLVPLKTQGDVIFFRDGMKTVCHEKAWEENGEIKCEYDGAILSYQKKDVIRIEKTRIEKQTESPSDQDQAPIEATAKPAKVASEVKQPLASDKKPSVQNESEAISKKPDISAIKGLEFYNPRRPKKYWTSATSKHHSFKEAIATLAQQYDRTPEWIQHHMGETNDLHEIHQNLQRSKLNAPVVPQEKDEEKLPETLFYNPRRALKYWTSASSKHKTFKEAIGALAKEYKRTPEWVQQYMGTTNDLGEIHRNLANRKKTEASP